VLFIITGLRIGRMCERWPNRSFMQIEPAGTPASQEQVGHLDELLDKALADSFPASDPVSSLVTDDQLPAATDAP
jgi:hypothetical protein